MAEQTLAIIKPDAVDARNSGKIIQRIEEAGFTYPCHAAPDLSRREAEGFYAVHRERPFFGSLTAFMSSGPAIVMALEAPDAIRKWRTLMGATDPAKADAGTLRKEFGASIENNATHGSDAPETAASNWVISSLVSIWCGNRKVVVGRLLVVVGLLIAGIGAAGDARDCRFGRLPGDIVLRRGSGTFYFPLATSIRGELSSSRC